MFPLCTYRILGILMSATMFTVLAEPVRTLRSQQDYDTAMNVQKPTIIKFSAAWCPACKKFKKTFEDIAGTYPEVQFFEIDTDELGDIAQAFEISSLPTVVYLEYPYQPKNERPKQTVGALSHEGFKDRIATFLKNIKPTKKDVSPSKAAKSPIRAVQIIKTRDNYDAALKSSKPTIIKFSAVWCPACQHFNKPFATLATKYPEAQFLEIDVDNPELKEIVTAYGISALPTIIYRQVGAMSENKFERNIVALLDKEIKKRETAPAQKKKPGPKKSTRK